MALTAMSIRSMDGSDSVKHLLGGVVSMQYKKLWIAFGLVMLVSFAVLGGVGYKASTMGRRSRRRSLPPTGECCSPARPFATARTSGSPLAARKSERSGDTVLTSLPTGAPIIFTANRKSCSNRWARQQGFADLSRDAG